MVLLRVEWVYIYDRRLQMFWDSFHSQVPQSVYTNVQSVDASQDPQHRTDGIFPELPHYVVRNTHVPAVMMVVKDLAKI